MLLYNSFLWQSPKNVMQATKIDSKNKKKRDYSTYAAMQHNELNLMKTLCVWVWGGGTKCSAHQHNVR